MRNGIIYSLTNKISGLTWSNNHIGGGINPLVLEFDSRITELPGFDNFAIIFYASGNDSINNEIVQSVSNLRGIGFISDPLQFFAESIEGNFTSDNGLSTSILATWSSGDNLSRNAALESNISSLIVEDENSFIIKKIRTPALGKLGKINIDIAVLPIINHPLKLACSLIRVLNGKQLTVVKRVITVTNDSKIFQLLFYHKILRVIGG
ncbi:hypothetical protein GTU79_18430 [Sodalis ligni]|uniref:hypothetical protein n=1 Tax=Sodalis ligni TaxID=2697027 RepID=UPI001BDF00B3|nr:hypothetical protein [Sodalis ligni]QWA09358.1 hypothetical protein GTU79_18430 [Sodalis ligni]